MVRTKADCSGIRVSGAKAPRKIVTLKPVDQGTSNGSNSGQYSGGNPYKPQPTPEWQKEITRFFGKNDSSAGTSHSLKNAEKEGNDSSNQGI